MQNPATGTHVYIHQVIPHVREHSGLVRSVFTRALCVLSPRYLELWVACVQAMDSPKRAFAAVYPAAFHPTPGPLGESSRASHPISFTYCAVLSTGRQAVHASSGKKYPASRQVALESMLQTQLLASTAIAQTEHQIQHEVCV